VPWCEGSSDPGHQQTCAALRAGFGRGCIEGFRDDGIFCHEKAPVGCGDDANTQTCRCAAP